MTPEQKIKAFVVASLRRATYRFPPRYNVFNAARVERGKYKCAQCKGVFSRKDVAVDHVIPIVGPEGFTTWDAYINRMFVDESGWQVLCRDVCHAQKTKAENAERKLVRDANKASSKKDAKIEEKPLTSKKKRSKVKK